MSCGIALPLGCSPEAIRVATVRRDRLPDGIQPVSPIVCSMGVAVEGSAMAKPLRCAAALDNVVISPSRCVQHRAMFAAKPGQ